MDRIVAIRGRQLRLNISRVAAARLEQCSTPLLLETALYFSFLIRKHVHVRESAAGVDTIEPGEKLRVWFRPVVTRTRAIDSCEPGQPPVTDMPG